MKIETGHLSTIKQTPQPTSILRLPGSMKKKNNFVFFHIYCSCFIFFVCVLLSTHIDISKQTVPVLLLSFSLAQSFLLLTKGNETKFYLKKKNTRLYSQ